MTIEELAYYFVVYITKKNSETQYHHAVKALTKLKSQGWQLEDIKKELDQFATEHPKDVLNVYHIEEIIQNKPAAKNLITEGTFYYHNHLRKPRKPPVLKFNPETRSYERIVEPYSLEMKTTFTIDDLLQYWYQSNHLTNTDFIYKRDASRFEYLLQYYDLDEILFMIDEAQMDREAKHLSPLTNIFELERYAEQAKETLLRKKSLSRMEKVDFIVQKR